MAQTIKNIFEFGHVKKIKIEYKKFTNYWDLKGKRNSTQKRHRKKIDEILNESKCLENVKRYLASCGLRIGPIPIYKAEDEMCFDEKIEFKIYQSTIEETKAKVEVNKKEVLNTKDSQLISDFSYDKIRKVIGKSAPALKSLRKERTRQNFEYGSMFKKRKNDHGSYIDCKKYITHHIKKNIDKLKLKVAPANAIRVKLSGDGTNIGKKNKILNFTFTLPDLGQVAKTSKGNYTKLADAFIGDFSFFSCNNNDFDTYNSHDQITVMVKID